MARGMELREISWGSYSGGDVGTCIYVLGHKEKGYFLGLLKCALSLDTPLDERELLTPDSVKHTRFRPMSPSEAREWGCSSGVREATDEDRGYPVTAVFL